MVEEFKKEKNNFSLLIFLVLWPIFHFSGGAIKGIQGLATYLKNANANKTFLSLLAILWNSVFKWVYLSLYVHIYVALCILVNLLESYVYL